MKALYPKHPETEEDTLAAAATFTRRQPGLPDQSDQPAQAAALSFLEATVRRRAKGGEEADGRNGRRQDEQKPAEGSRVASANQRSLGLLVVVLAAQLLWLMLPLPLPLPLSLLLLPRPPSPSPSSSSSASSSASSAPLLLHHSLHLHPTPSALFSPSSPPFSPSLLLSPSPSRSSSSPSACPQIKSPLSLSPSPAPDALLCPSIHAPRDSPGNTFYAPVAHRSMALAQQSKRVAAEFEFTAEHVNRAVAEFIHEMGEFAVPPRFAPHTILSILPAPHHPTLPLRIFC